MYAPIPNSAPSISAEELPATLHGLLLDGDHDQADKLRLAGVVQYQLKRAAAANVPPSTTAKNR